MARLLLALVALIPFGSAYGEEGPDRWRLRDQGTERSWSNTNQNGASINLLSCENPANRDYYRLTFAGVLEPYLMDSGSAYSLNLRTGDYGDVIYHHLSLDYLDFTFSSTIPKVVAKAGASSSISLCARRMDSSEDVCETFAGTNLSEPIGDLCLAHD